MQNAELMHQLYIDIGNSYLKAAQKEGVNWRTLFRCTMDEKEDFFSWIENRMEDRMTLCSVNQSVLSQIRKRVTSERLRVITYKDVPLDMIEYNTPKTLGMDRFIACFGASLQSPGSVVVIDAGSACTLDFMKRGSVYHGGVIMPGLQMFIRSMTRELPSLPSPDTILPETWPGQTTMDSLRWGTTGTYFTAIRSFLQKFETHFGQFDLFLTGGESDLIRRYLEPDYTLKVRPHLVFEGMREFSDRYFK